MREFRSDTIADDFINREVEEDTNYQYAMDLSKRNTGKSYAWRGVILCGIENIPNYKGSNLKKKTGYLQTGEKYIHLVRNSNATGTTRNVTNYWSDFPVEEVTNGKYNTIQAYGQGIYLSNIDEKGKIIRGEQFGYIVGLMQSGAVKSTLRNLGITRIVYEEFIPTNGIYLYNEPDMLQDLVSTVFGDIEGHVVLIANKISRVNPYFYQWNLRRALKQKPKTSERYCIEDDTYIQIAIPDMKTSKSRMFFGSKGKQIEEGVFEATAYPCMTRDLYNNSYVIDKLTFLYQDFNYCIERRYTERGSRFLYIYPSKKIHRQIVTNKYHLSQNVHTYFQSTSPQHKAIVELWHDGKIVYADNSIANDFIDVVKGSGLMQPLLLEYDEEFFDKII